MSRAITIHPVEVHILSDFGVAIIRWECAVDSFFGNETVLSDERIYVARIHMRETCFDDYVDRRKRRVTYVIVRDDYNACYRAARKALLRVDARVAREAA